MDTNPAPMRITREWAMPDSNTFNISCIKQFIYKYKTGLVIDPFANKNRIASITNDIDPSMNCNYNLDAREFLKIFDVNSIDAVLFDPPYSPRQIAEVYKKMGQSVNMETTQSSFWSILKNQIKYIVRPGGYVLSFGWNSNGMGINRGFQMIEILMVAHGGAHNDTICLCEQKIEQTIF